VDLLLEFCVAKLHAGITLTPEGGVAAQVIGGARPPQVAIGRASGGTPAKPGFLRSKKCALISYLSLIHPLHQSGIVHGGAPTAGPLDNMESKG
jgi:hypothetical protein